MKKVFILAIVVLVLVGIGFYFYASNIVDKNFQENQTEYKLAAESCYGKCSSMGLLSSFCVWRKKCDSINSIPGKVDYDYQTYLKYKTFSISKDLLAFQQCYVDCSKSSFEDFKLCVKEYKCDLID